MAAETIAFFLLGVERDDLISRFRTAPLQWSWLRGTLINERSKRGG